MTDEKPVEIIYVARVIKNEGVEVQDRFALNHEYAHSPRHGAHNHFNYSLSREGLIGYLEGATATMLGHVREISNGIPTSVRGGSYPKIEIDKLAASDLATICEEAGLTHSWTRDRVKINL